MSRRVGLEFAQDRIRAVTLAGWRASPVETFELKWDPAVPRDAVALLTQHLGRVSSISLAIGLGFTHVKNVPLPPAPDEERRAMLTLEPDRFFAVEGGEMVVATRHDSDLVFAADRPLVDAWIAELERWAPVSNVESASASLARAIRRGKAEDGAYRLEASEGEVGLVEMKAGSLRTVRRLPASESVGRLQAPPAVKGVPPAFLVAYGAALGRDDSTGEMLVPAAIASRIGRRRLTSLARSAVNLLLALAVAAAALDRSRSRLLERAEAEIASLEPRAAGGAALQSRLASLEVQSAAAGERTLRADPVAVLAALTRRLPRDATVMSVRADGDKWQVDGTARSAGDIVPALDADPMFDDVRFLAGTSRFTEGSRTYETFSVAFRARR